MKKEITYKVTELSHEDLVEILSVALTGCDWTMVEYDKDLWRTVPHYGEECIEDICADLLLAGHTIGVRDLSAEGEVYTSKTTEVDLNDGSVLYTLAIEDFLDGCSTEEGYGYAKELLEDCEGDYYTANNLLQIIMFGDVVYG